MRYLELGNYIIKTSIYDILIILKATLNNNKLKDIIKSGEDIKVTCPVHKGGAENKPAAGIYVGDNLNIPYGYYNCFVCGAKGTFDKFVADCFNSSIEYARAWLIKNFGEEKETDLPKFLDDIQIYKSQPQQLRLNENILDKYLDWTPYLQKRGLSRELCAKFKIKYDPKHRCVVFPIYDKNGNLISITTRSIDTKTFHLDSNIAKPIYCIDKIVKYHIDKFMVVEGPIDCLTAYQYNVPAVAFFGAMTKEQIQQLNKLCPKVIYIATDNDAAGDKFASQIKKILNKNIIVERIKLPINRKDVNELTKEEWINLIKKYNLPQIEIN